MQTGFTALRSNSNRLKSANSVIKTPVIVTNVNNSITPVKI